MTQSTKVNRRALVTGGAGFIGSHVVETLLARGYAVTVADNLSSGKRENVAEGADLVVCDIASPQFTSLVEKLKPDVIAHLAAQIDVRRSIEDPLADAQTNIVALVQMMETVKRAAPRCRVVLTSTAGVYGDAPNPPLDEATPLSPLSPYAISKSAAERYLEHYARIENMESVILRFANVYGPRQDPKGEAGVVSIFCSRIKAGMPITVFGDGKQTRDYVFVRDVAEAIALACEVSLGDSSKSRSPVYNIGTGRSTSVLALIKAIEEVAQREATVVFEPLRPGEIIDSALDASRARAGLSWVPAVRLAEGLAVTHEAISAAS